jgi:hypothetical protein
MLRYETVLWGKGRRHRNWPTAPPSPSRVSRFRMSLYLFIFHCLDYRIETEATFKTWERRSFSIRRYHDGLPSPRWGVVSCNGCNPTSLRGVNSPASRRMGPATSKDEVCSTPQHSDLIFRHFHRGEGVMIYQALGSEICKLAESRKREVGPLYKWRKLANKSMDLYTVMEFSLMVSSAICSRSTGTNNYSRLTVTQ